MSCLFEPIHGRFPTHSICDSYPDCVGCSYSDPFKQPKQTNADRIRAMSDEELAKFIERTMFMVYESVAKVCRMVGYAGQWDSEGIIREEIEWLKQEAKT